MNCVPRCGKFENNSEHEDKELEILENIYHSSSSVRQRDLAEIVGLSLGMTNAILKRLVKKGLLTVRKVNNRNIRYAVFPCRCGGHYPAKATATLSGP